MEFEVFNRDTEKTYHATSIRVSFTRLKFKGRITTGAARMMGLKPGGKVELLRLGDTWHIAGSQNERGYHLTGETGEASRAGLAFTSAAAVRQIFRDAKTTKHRLDFYIHETKHEHQGYKVYELLPVPPSV